MPILDSTKDVTYQHLSFLPTEDKTVIFHFAATIDKPLLPIVITESQEKKNFITALQKLAKQLADKLPAVETRIFKMKFLAPGRIEDIFNSVQRPIVRAKYDVVVMIICDNEEIANAVQMNESFLEIKSLFQEKPEHNIVTAKNIRKAGNVHIRDHYNDGYYLFNYFYVEDKKLDFLPVWEHTSRWFAQFAKLDNSYLLKPVSGDENFQYINHCYWPKITEFVWPLISNKSAKTYVLDNFSYNKAIAFPIIYTVVDSY